MANLPISGLTASASNLASTDLAPVVQTVGVGPVKMTGLQLAGGLLGSTTFNGATSVGTALSTVAITGTGGQFSCAAATLAVGQNVTISGTLGGTGSITGYSSPTTYTISATNGSTTFTLVNASTGAALTTTAGTPTGLTYVVTSPVVNFTQTWNNSNVTFTGLKFNATDTASASGSLLLDLQVGGVSKFKVDKTERIYFQAVTPSSGSTIYFDQSYTDFRGSSGIALSSNTAALRFGSSTDLLLTRAAAATLQLGAADAAAPVAQTFKVQSGTAGASALSCSISGTTLTVGGAVTGTIAIGHAVTGTGVSAGTVITAGSGASWTVNNSQTVSSTTMYFNSVGADFTIRGSQGSGPSAGGNIVFQVAPAGSAATTAQNAYQTVLQITGAGGLTGQDGATANTLALRNGTNAQLFRVYSTYNGTNDAYGAIGAGVKLDGTYASGDENILYIGSQKKGSPTALTKLAIQVDGTTRLNYGVTGATTWAFSGTIYSDSAGGAPDLNGWDNKAAIRGSGNYWSLGTSGSPAANAFSLFTYNGGSFSTPAFSVTQSGVPWLCQFTATPASGSANAHVNLGTTSNFGIYYGSGAPTVSAAQGSIYLRSDGSGTSDRMYVNTDGATTWTAVTTAA